MATSYTIRVGYNSRHRSEDVWETLKGVCKSIQGNPNKIEDEVLRLEPEWPRLGVRGFAERYRNPTSDLTIQYYEKDEDRCVRQSASGGGSGRALKEACRRAFCRLVINEMHTRMMEVSITVN